MKELLDKIEALEERVLILEQSDKIQVIINWIISFILGMFVADYILR